MGFSNNSIHAPQILGSKCCCSDMPAETPEFRLAYRVLNIVSPSVAAQVNLAGLIPVSQLQFFNSPNGTMSAIETCTFVYCFEVQAVSGLAYLNMLYMQNNPILTDWKAKWYVGNPVPTNVDYALSPTLTAVEVSPTSFKMSKTGIMPVSFINPDANLLPFAILTELNCKDMQATTISSTTWSPGLETCNTIPYPNYNIIQTPTEFGLDWIITNPDFILSDTLRVGRLTNAGLVTLNWDSILSGGTVTQAGVRWNLNDVSAAVQLSHNLSMGNNRIVVRMMGMYGPNPSSSGLYPIDIVLNKFFNNVHFDNANVMLHSKIIIP